MLIKCLIEWVGWDFNLVDMWRVEKSFPGGQMPKVVKVPHSQKESREIKAKSRNTLCISSKFALAGTNYKIL